MTKQLASQNTGGGGGGEREGSRQRKKNKPQNIPLNPYYAPEAEQPQQRQAVLQLELTEEQKETQEVFHKFQSILNKLTPQNCKSVAKQIQQLYCWGDILCGHMNAITVPV